MPITGMNHGNIMSTDLAKTEAFYSLLGLTPGPRPKFQFGGLWLYAEGRPVLHVNLRPELPDTRYPGGVFDHIAFTGANLEHTVRQLRDAGHEVDIRAVPPGDNIEPATQIFVTGPSGEKIEVVFPGATMSA